MTSIWEPTYGEPDEITVIARPTSPDATPQRRRQRSDAVDQARRAARGLRALAWFLAVSGAAAHPLLYWWTDDDVQVWPDAGWRGHLGVLLERMAFPLALGGVVYAIATFILLYAARLDAEVSPMDTDRDR